jgi:transposase-like protein
MSKIKSLERTAASLRDRVRIVQASNQRRYPESLRAEIMECTTGLLEAGVTWDRCSEVIGISTSTLYYWRTRDAQPSSAALVPVKIRRDDDAPASSGPLTLRTPNGLELSGMDLAEAAQLLRVLG